MENCCFLSSQLIMPQTNFSLLLTHCRKDQIKELLQVILESNHKPAKVSFLHNNQLNQFQVKIHQTKYKLVKLTLHLFYKMQELIILHNLDQNKKIKK